MCRRRVPPQRAARRDRSRSRSPSPPRPRAPQRNVDDQTAAATDEGLRGLQPDQLELVAIIRQALQFKQPLPRNVYEAVRLELPAELKHRAEASNLRRGFGADYVRPV